MLFQNFITLFIALHFYEIVPFSSWATSEVARTPRDLLLLSEWKSDKNVSSRVFDWVTFGSERTKWRLSSKDNFSDVQITISTVQIFHRPLNAWPHMLKTILINPWDLLNRPVHKAKQLYERVCDRKRAFDATRNRGRNGERQFLFKSRNFPFHHYYDKKYRRENCFYVSRGNSVDIAKRKSLHVLSIYRNLFIFVKKTILLKISL